MMKAEIAMGDCIKRDLERVGEEWRTRATDRRNWRLLIENVVREELEVEKRQGKRKSWSTHP